MSAPAPRRRFRMNVRGWVFLVLVLAVGAAALAKGNNLLFFAFASLAGLFTISLILTWLGGRGIEVGRLAPDDARAAEPFAVTLRIRNARRLLPAFALRFEDTIAHEGAAARIQPPPVLLPSARAGERVRGSYSAVVLDRGPARLGPVRMTVEFPPGFATAEVTLPVEDEVLVLPRRGTLLRRAVVSMLSRVEACDLASVPRVAGDDEFAGVREYRPGDSPRRIHWKMSARVPGRLLVREFEPSRARRAVVLLDTCVPNPHDARRRLRLERAVSFCAALVEELLAEGYSAGFRAFGPEYVSMAIEPRRGALRDLEAALALLRSTRNRPLHELLAMQDPAAGEVYFVLRLGDEEPPPWAGAERAVALGPAEMRAAMRFEGDGE
ncbi:MAG: DUF58 domain-containing protein [Planctomycetes bacterium]|nr:DUF58 domain-containing protein [Planctomycetota bacterium]